jgi:hypothetical protein
MDKLTSAGLFAILGALIVGFLGPLLVPFLGIAGAYASAVAAFILIALLAHFMVSPNWTNNMILGLIGAIGIMLILPFLTPFLGFAGTWAGTLGDALILFVAAYFMGK